MNDHFQGSYEQPAVPPELWPLDPGVTFLNHGSFGSCPRAVLAHQQKLRERMERQPVLFLVGDLEPLLDEARARVAAFLGGQPDNLVFVSNATTGVNTVLRSLKFRPGDELLVTNHEYQACRNALDFVAERAGARVVGVEMPFPLADSGEAVEAVMKCVTARTRLALIDHVTSQTGLVLPVAEMVSRLKDAGVETLVDGAHAPGMVPLELDRLGAAYYTGNCHKWLCAPKTAGFLYVAPVRQELIRPLTISHGASSKRTDRTRFQIEFGWTGTWDPTACLSVPEALDYLGGLLPGGWPEIMERNRRLTLRARQLLGEALGVARPCPDGMIGSLASLRLPAARNEPVSRSPLYEDPLQDQLREQFGVEVPIIPWPGPPQRLVRISCQLYNALPQYVRLAEALGKLL
jgi:isopenicillin-N epimerase